MAKRKSKKKNQNAKVNFRGRGSRTQVNRSLRRNEYVVYRDRRGRIRKPRRDLLLYAEVRSRKTGLRVGFLNKFSKGEPVPNRVSPKQRAVFEAVTEKRFEHVGKETDLSFTIYSKNRIDSQITREFYNGVMDQQKRYEKIFLMMDVATSRGDYGVAPDLYIDRVWHFDLFVTEVTHIILKVIDELNLRMSPKKEVRKIGKRLRRSRVDITRSARIRVGIRKEAA